jgi:hypothetical protein
METHRAISDVDAGAVRLYAAELSATSCGESGL